MRLPSLTDSHLREALARVVERLETDSARAYAEGLRTRRIAPNFPDLEKRLGLKRADSIAAFEREVRKSYGRRIKAVGRLH